MLVDSKTYEFDIYLLQTGSTAFELSGCQIGLTFNDNVRNGGNLTAIIIPGTCTFSNLAQAPGNPNVASTVVVLGVTKRVWKLASKAPPGVGSGSIISAVAPGTRVGRFRLTNTVDFLPLPAFFRWTFISTQYETKISAYVGGLNIPITVQGSHENALSNIALPVELSSFTAIGQGRDVNLSWETKTEVSSSKFLVERTAQSTQNWVRVGEVAASGNSNSTKEYSFTDKKLNSGKYIYRLKMIDADGTYRYSKEVESRSCITERICNQPELSKPIQPYNKDRLSVSIRF